MRVWTHGEVACEDGRFTARFNGDPAVVARLKTIQRCHWQASRAVWAIDAHWPSVSVLIRIALDQRWKISAAAWNEKERVQVVGESLEYSIDMIHDNQGHARFRCTVGNDDQLRDEVKSIPGAYWEDEYYSVPTDWDHCCPPIRAIVERDMRFTVSPAAVRLLEDEDVSHLYIRTLAPPSVAERRELSRKPSPAAVYSSSMCGPCSLRCTGMFARSCEGSHRAGRRRSARTRRAAVTHGRRRSAQRRANGSTVIGPRAACIVPRWVW